MLYHILSSSPFLKKSNPPFYFFRHEDKRRKTYLQELSFHWLLLVLPNVNHSISVQCITCHIGEYICSNITVVYIDHLISYKLNASLYIYLQCDDKVSIYIYICITLKTKKYHTVVTVPK